MGAAQSDVARRHRGDAAERIAVAITPMHAHVDPTGALRHERADDEHSHATAMNANDRSAPRRDAA